MKPSPLTPPKAKASGFRLRQTSTAQSEDESDADEVEGETQGKARAKIARVRRKVDPPANSEKSAPTANQNDTPVPRGEGNHAKQHPIY